MRAPTGLYNKKASVERGIREPTKFGGAKTRWQPLHTNIACYIRLLSGTEQRQASQITGFSTHRLYCAVRDIDVTDRVIFKGEWYDVLAVARIRDDRFMQIDLELRRSGTLDE